MIESILDGAHRAPHLRTRVWFDGKSWRWGATGPRVASVMRPGDRMSILDGESWYVCGPFKTEQAAKADLAFFVQAYRGEDQ